MSLTWRQVPSGLGSENGEIDVCFPPIYDGIRVLARSLRRRSVSHYYLQTKIQLSPRFITLVLLRNHFTNKYIGGWRRRSIIHCNACVIRGSPPRRSYYWIDRFRLTFLVPLFSFEFQYYEPNNITSGVQFNLERWSKANAWWPPDIESLNWKFK